MRTALLRHASFRLLKNQPDHVLVELVHAGHQPAFDAIVIRYGYHLLRVARAVGPSERAEDVVQQALLQAYRALREHEEVVELRPWLRRIVLNASIDLSRRTGPRPEVVRDEELVGESVESVLERRHQLAKLVRALGDLPDRQREAIVMRELEGRPFEEIASEFGTTHGGARQLVRRARARLRTGVATLVPPALLARMLAQSAPHAEAAGPHSADLAGAGGFGVGAKVCAVVAVGSSALAVGTFAPPADQAARQPRIAPPASRNHTTRADRAKPATGTPPAVVSTARAAPRDVGRPASTVGAEQQGNHEGGAGQVAAAEVGQHDGQSQAGETHAPNAAGGGGARAASASQPDAGPNVQTQQGGDGQGA